MGNTESDYIDIILESANAVREVRRQVGIQSFHAMSLIHPEIMLTEPAIFRHLYKWQFRKDINEAKAVTRVMRLLQKQKEILIQSNPDLIDLLKDSPLAQVLLGERQTELETHSMGVGLRAAQTCSSVVRLSPAVNHVFAELSAFARSIRSGKPEAHLKSHRLFEVIQQKMVDAIGPESLS